MIPPLLADENVDQRILDGLTRLRPNLRIIGVRDAGLAASPDPSVLAWAARGGCILLTHDVNTMTEYADARVRQGLPMPGVIAVQQQASIGPVIRDILLVLEASLDGEIENQVRFVPL